MDAFFQRLLHLGMQCSTLVGWLVDVGESEEVVYVSVPFSPPFLGRVKQQPAEKEAINPPSFQSATLSRLTHSP